MSWVNDLASAAGIPAGAATLAVAMYAACTAAEKAASQQALSDIGRIVKDTTWERSVRPSAVIEQVFNWTFGERHLSWKCVRRSIAATAIFIGIFVLLMYAETNGTPDFSGGWASFLADLLTGFLIGSLVSDYLALGKTRILLRATAGRPGALSVCILTVFDIVFSLLISVFLNRLGEIVWFLILFHGTWVADPLFQPISSEMDVARKLLNPPLYGYPWYGIFVLSTLFTSVWTVLVLLSTTVLKLLSPVQHLTAWFFDVDKHPVQAIGIVAGALTMLGSLIWTLLRAVI